LRLIVTTYMRSITTIVICLCSKKFWINFNLFYYNSYGDRWNGCSLKHNSKCLIDNLKHLGIGCNGYKLIMLCSLIRSQLTLVFNEESGHCIAWVESLGEESEKYLDKFWTQFDLICCDGCYIYYNG
jgi:hypothetical protein